MKILEVGEERQRKTDKWFWIMIGSWFTLGWPFLVPAWDFATCYWIALGYGCVISIIFAMLDWQANK